MNATRIFGLPWPPTPHGDKIRGICWVPWEVARTVELMQAAGFAWFVSMDADAEVIKRLQACGYAGNVERVRIGDTMWAVTRRSTEAEAAACGAVLRAAGDTRPDVPPWTGEFWEPVPFLGQLRGLHQDAGIICSECGAVYGFTSGMLDGATEGMLVNFEVEDDTACNLRPAKGITTPTT